MKFEKADVWRLTVVVLAVFVVIFLAAKAFAAGPTATISWTHPVMYTDGSVLALSEIKETVITWRRPGSTVNAGSVRVVSPSNTTVVSGLACGNFNFTAVTVVKANDVQSDEGGPVLYATGVQCAPNPPTGLKVI